MSGNHRRKSRNQKREWRYAATKSLFTILRAIDIKSARKIRSLTFGGPNQMWDFVCRFDKK